ncbi:MAG: LysM peptidoglycan-binding domain-containing protein [Firmicutes bacterium]|nr:LysM peptidoglycan-binding domain-containing protein [Bacillota bacterium]
MKKDAKDPVRVKGIPPPPATCSGQLYTVIKGDTMYLLSIRFDVPLADLINANPQISNPNVIHPGQVVCIPGKKKVFSTGPLFRYSSVLKRVNVYVENNSNKTFTYGVRLYNKDKCPKIVYKDFCGNVSPGCTAVSHFDISSVNFSIYEVMIEVPKNARVMASVYGLTYANDALPANTLRHSELVVLYK